MSTQEYYVIDSSSLIELNRMNPMDIYESVWKNLEVLLENGFLISPEEVMKEVSKKDDELRDWAKQHKKMFIQLDEFQIQKVIEIQSKYPSFVDPDKENPVADPFVIALALEKDPQQTIIPIEKKRIVVSEEKLRGNKIKIPYVCQQYDIECIDVFELFRREKWKF